MSGDAWRIIVRAHGGPEAIERELRERGYQTGMYYQMD